MDYDFSVLRNILFDRPGKILILSHRNPDGDAIGASLALLMILRKLKHDVSFLVPNHFPDFLGWMPDAHEILIHATHKNKVTEIHSQAQVIFAIDFNDLSRIKEFEKFLTSGNAYKVLIDHHPNPQKFADLAISDTQASSTSELVFSLIKSLGIENLIDKDIATCLYVGIMTDTGCFSFNSSRPETFSEVADLLKYNIDKDKIFDLVYDNYSFNRMRLMGYCLDQKMIYLPEFRTAFISLTKAELKAYNFKNGDSEGFVNLPLSIKDVRFSAIFIENSDLIRISMRSKGDFPVNDICADHFNGGGHKNAAGGESYESLEKTVDKFIKLLPRYRDELLKD